MPVTALDPKSALVVIDLQRGLSNYPTIHPFQDVVANTARLASAFRRARLPGALVTVSFAADGGERFQPRSQVPARAFPMSPEFVSLVPELGPEPGDILITKRQWSAFYGTELDLQLRRRHVTNIVLTGVVTSIGVDSTARAAPPRREHGAGGRRHEHRRRFDGARGERARLQSHVCLGCHDGCRSRGA